VLYVQKERVGNPLTTYYCIAMLHEIYGATFFVWGGVGYAETGAGFVE
jgi:hypothetical protein